jgi:hypothetical protein
MSNIQQKRLNVSVTELEGRLEQQSMSAAAFATVAVLATVSTNAFAIADRCGPANQELPCPQPSCGWSF